MKFVNIHFKGIKETHNFRGAREFVEFLSPRSMRGKFVMSETTDGGIAIVGRDVPCRFCCSTEIRGRFNPPHLE